MTTLKANNSAMSGQIPRANQVDTSKITFCDPTVNKYGGKSAKVKYDGKDFLIQTPRMRLPWGLGTYEEKDKNGNVLKTKYSLDFSFAGYEEGENGEVSAPKVREFYNLLQEMQKILVKAAMDNSATWLDMDEITEGVAKALTRDLIKFSKDKVTKKITNNYPPTFKSKLGFWDGRFMVNAFDENRKKIDDLGSFLVRGTQAIGILKLTGVNFAGGKVGYSFQCQQLKLYLPQGLPAYAFREDSDDEKPVVSKLQDKEDSDEGQNKVANTVSDSDESDDDLDVDDEESEEDREPTPPPAKKTKIVRKKK